MKMTKRWLSVLLCVIMTVMAFAVTVVAAGGETNVEFVADKTAVSVDDTFTISFRNKEMTVKGFTGGFTFDTTLLECVSIVGVDPDYPDDFSLISGGGRGGVTYTAPTAISSIEQANANGTVGYAYAGVKDVTYLENTLYIVTFKAKDAGTANFTLYEQSNGTDAFASDNIDTIVVTIKSATTECSHEYEYDCSKTCKLCGVETRPEATHTVDPSKTTYYEAMAATCCKAGNQWKYTYCACGYNFAPEELKGTIPATGMHNLEKTDGRAATCILYGYKAYWICMNSGCYYADAEGKNLIEDFGTWISAGGDGYIPVDPTAHSFLNNNRGSQLTFGDCTNAATYATKCDNCDYEDKAKVITGEKDPTTHTGEVKYTNNGDTHSAAYTCCGAPVVTNEAHTYENHTCVCGAKFTGWDGKVYYKDAVMQTGWTEIDGAWYYLDPETGVRAEGLTRVPYPTVDINGWGYEPNPEDIAYAEKKGETFIDADEAWFLFDEDGKFNQYSGIMEYEGAKRYLIGGIMEWHIGMVTEDGVNYYFVGDAEIGGNKAAEGIVYITRIAGYDDFKPGYVIFKNGQVDASEEISIESVTNSKGQTNSFYFEKGICVPGKGLVMIEEGKYIFVRSAGQLAIGEYWVTPEKANGLVKGGRIYVFDENGYMTSDVSKNGIVDGKYYVEGELTYAGLIKIDGDIYYINSKGEVVTGTYYVTKTNGMEGFSAGDKLVFGEDGKMETIKDGIVEENGELYYYNKNHLMCGAGLIEIDGDIYYVRSSGKVQTGYFYITNTNDMEGFAAGDLCKFGEDGKLLFVCE